MSAERFPCFEFIDKQTGVIGDHTGTGLWVVEVKAERFAPFAIGLAFSLCIRDISVEEALTFGTVLVH